MQDVKTESDYQKILQKSKDEPVFLYKHSSACSISLMAAEQVAAFLKQYPQQLFYRVLVIEERPLSLKIAEQAGIAHQSPQLILFKDAKAVWKVSHHQITVEKIKEAVTKT